MRERWKWIKGYRGRYKVSSFGRVYSVPRTRPSKAGSISRVQGRILKGTDNWDGYLIVGLAMPGKKTRIRGIHQLVATAFVRKPKTKYELEVNHLDGNKYNNHYLNLEWTTSRGNSNHAMANGLLKPLRGQDKVEAKLDDASVRVIKRLWPTGNYTQGQLGNWFGVTQSVISTIVNNKAWGHINT